jgi:hypothetical protein
VSALRRLQVILSVLYWLVVGVVLWFGYIGDEQIDQASKTPVTHSAAFDTMAVLGLAAIAYAIVCAVWWAATKLTRRAT